MKYEEVNMNNAEGVKFTDETVCHCNIKENAALIAAILDCDVKGAIHPYAIRYATELVENIDKLE